MANDKKILAVSKETHRGVSIYEIAPNGPVCFVLGMTVYEVAKWRDLNSRPHGLEKPALAIQMANGDRNEHTAG